jgi:hypothetical protein
MAVYMAEFTVALNRFMQYVTALAENTCVISFIRNVADRLYPLTITPRLPVTCHPILTLDVGKYITESPFLSSIIRTQLIHVRCLFGYVGRVRDNANSRYRLRYPTFDLCSRPSKIYTIVKIDFLEIEKLCKTRGSLGVSLKSMLSGM